MRFCTYVFSDAAGAEPSAKQAKLDDSADLSGGLQGMLKSKTIEVRSAAIRIPSSLATSEL